MQDGVALQPQDYMLDGITPLPRCIVITSTATVAPDATTGAAAFMAANVVLVGTSASLASSVNSKGLLGFVRGLLALRGGAHLHMDKLGKAGNFGDLSPDMLLPTALAKRIGTRKLKAYVVKGEGALGAGGFSGASAVGPPGDAAGPMQTGGGGTGCCWYSTIGRGGKGGPCCGGAASGGGNWANTLDAGDYGGPGSAGTEGRGALACGGAGDPPGSGVSGGNPGAGPGGGLLGLFARKVDIAPGCLVSADGAKGGENADNVVAGGSAGGGIVIIVTMPGGYTNQGTVRANGGAATLGGGSAGGAGSVNIFELAA